MLSVELTGESRLGTASYDTDATVYCLPFCSAMTPSTCERMSAMVFLGSSEPKTAVPATRTFEPVYQRRSERNHATGNILTSLGALACIARTNTAVDLDVLARESFAKGLDFLQALGHELLSTATGVHSHDEEQVGSFAQVVCDCARGCVGGDGDTDFHVVGFDQLDD